MEEWQKPETIVLWIIIAVVFFLLLITIITLLIRSIFQKIVKTKDAESKAKLEYQENLLNTTIKTQEIERKRIASDLHDALISKLTVLQIKEQIERENEETAALVMDCIAVARRISHDLSPPLLEYTSLNELIKEILHPWKGILAVNFREDLHNEVEFSADFKIQFTRIIQEIITNISKHSEAKELNVYFRQSERWLAFLIQDNGKGFSMDKKQKGLGLQNIEIRVQYLKGRYRIRSAVNRGTSSFFLFHLK